VTNIPCKQKFYLVFIVCNLANAIFFWCFQPETKGLNLEDMDELFLQSPTFVPGSKWTSSSGAIEKIRDGYMKDESKDVNTLYIENI
jgi:hypothetical protein